MHRPEHDLPPTLAEALDEIVRLRAEVSHLRERLVQVEAEHGLPPPGELESALLLFPEADQTAGVASRHDPSPDPAGSATEVFPLQPSAGGAAPRLAELPTDPDVLRQAIAEVRQERERSEAELRALLGPGPPPRSPRAQETGAATPRASLSFVERDPPQASAEPTDLDAPTRGRHGAALMAVLALVALSASVAWWFGVVPFGTGSAARGAASQAGPASSHQPSGQPAATVVAPSELLGEPAGAPEPAVPTPAANAAAATEVPATPPVSTGTFDVSFTLLREAWLRVTVDGQRVYQRTANAGDVLSFTARDAVSIRVGDAGAVRVAVGGADRGALGGNGQVVTREFRAGSQ